MRILVVALKHQLQITTSQCAGYEAVQLEETQKRQFGEMLVRLIEERGVQSIGEETKHGTESIAQRIAKQLGRRYANIEMHLTERQAKDIPAGYADEGTPFPPKEIAKRHKAREEYMFEKTIELFGGAESILILCGREHAEALARLFRNAGHTVDTYDVNEESWYIDDWAKHLLGS